MGKGHAFVSYAHEDLPRVQPLVEHLTAKGVAVFWDDDLEPGSVWRDRLHDMLMSASCTIVVWTVNSVGSHFVWDEADRARRFGTLVPVKLDAAVEAPLGFGQLQYVDLTGSDDARRTGLESLVRRVRRLVEQGHASPEGDPPVLDDGWVLTDSRRAVKQISDLTGRARTIAELLASTNDIEAARDFKGALDEVGKTYRIVHSAIEDFTKPALTAGPLDGEPYSTMASSLVATIREGRGHCDQIAVHYARVGGLRDAIRRVAPQLLHEADETFGRLSTADGDLFAQLVEIGLVLQGASRVIINLLLGGQQQAARERVVSGYMTLQPLQNDLDAALQQLLEIEALVGYARPQAET